MRGEGGREGGREGGKREEEVRRKGEENKRLIILNKNSESTRKR